MTTPSTRRGAVPHPPSSSSAVDGIPVPSPPAIPVAAARRRVNRKLLLAGVLAVLLGGVLAMSAGRALAHRTTVLVVARAVQAGSRISAADLTTAELAADPHLRPIPAAERDQVVGQIALADLRPGELLTRAQIGAGDGMSPGQMLVAVPLKDGQLPARGLTPGQRVLIVATPGDAVGATAASASPTAPIAGTVAEVGQRDQGSTVTVVDLRVAEADGPAVARLASTGRVALVLLPAGG